MTAAFLQSELSSLISDSKRKHTDIKSAAEKSSTDLKAIAVTSETQLAGDLLRKPHFIDPFLLACKSQNVKLASTGAACLQRLIASTAISRSRLSEVLSAFQDAVPLALEVQLKILQTLPSLLQLYTSDIHGESLAITLGISAELSGSKLAVVSNTASATFQQLVTSVFERVSSDRDQDPENGVRHEGKSNEDVRDAALVFSDISALLTGDPPRFVRLNGLSPALILETIENLLSNHGSDIIATSASLESCRKYLIPGLTRLIDGSTNFGVVARAFRITFILSTEYFEVLRVELETILFTVLNSLDRSAGIKWKRVLCLEFYRGICSDFESLRDIFLAYDQSEGAKNIVFELMATLVRIASEDPSLIGLGRQSTIPTNQAPDDSGDTVGAVDIPNAGTALGSVAQAGSTAAGISAEWSTTTASCLDQVDRSSAPDMPDTYIYTLVLGCVAAFSDGLSKYIMPLSVPTRKQIKAEDMEDDNDTTSIERPKASTQRFSTSQKYQQLVNPLTRTDVGKISEIQLSAKIIEDCWPAVLAICSTFLNAALDSYFYHILVRTVQKLTQVSGVLELNTPRDALLTTLAKVSVPVNVSRLMNYYYGARSAKIYDLEVASETEVTSPSTPIPNTPAESFDISRQSLNVRNLLCLRALLNLGIALGPTLSGSAWTIILQSLQQVEALMSVGPTPKNSAKTAANHGEGGSSSSLASEISAVETATKRMVESTKTYTNSAFGILVEAIFRMVDEVIPYQNEKAAAALSPVEHSNMGRKESRHHSTRSVSGSWTKTVTLEVEVQFILRTVARLSSVNVRRFSSLDSAAFTWNTIAAKLLALQNNEHLNLNLRFQAANVLDAIVLECGRTPIDGDSSVIVVQKYAIPCLQNQLKGLPKNTKDVNSLSVRTDIMLRLLGALETLVGQCADSFEDGWTAVFDIVNDAIKKVSSGEAEKPLRHDLDLIEPYEHKTNIAAFRCVQLIISDFLQVLDKMSLGRVVNLLALFGFQRLDLNMSLTAIALYWNIITLLLERTSESESRVLDLMSLQENKTGAQTQYSSLWRLNMTLLSQLCTDERSDVRNAAVRMLLKTLEATSQYLTPDSSNICIRDILLPLISSWTEKKYSNIDLENVSLLQLIEGTTSWIQTSISTVVEGASFDITWVQICNTFENTLAQRQLASSAAVYTSLSSIISALASLNDERKKPRGDQIIDPVWAIWISYHPADVVSKEQTNELALASHAHIVADLWNYCSSAVQARYIASEDDPIFISMIRTVSIARHTRYSNDIQKLSAEQEEVVQNMSILYQILADCQMRRVFSEGLVSFIRKCRDLAESNARQEHTSDCPNGLQRPTYTALLSHCLVLMRNFIIESADVDDFTQNVTIGPVLELMSNLCSRSQKESKIVDSAAKPVRRNASMAGVELITVVGRKLDSIALKDIEDLGNPLHEIIRSIITADSLEAFATKLSPEMAHAYEDEDIILFHRAHEAAISIIGHPDFSKELRQQYILMLFQSSLVAKPWFGDVPTDLAENLLQNIKSIRPGSLRAPELPPRRAVYVEAFNALLDLTTTHYRNEVKEADDLANLALAASPFVIFRIAHPLKVFLADQPLRYLTPPHSALQKELKLVLNKALNLRTKLSAFQNVPGINQAALSDDGKVHLRLLYPLILKVKDLWADLPRLAFCAWQDEEEGKAIEKALNAWGEALREGWDMD